MKLLSPYRDFLWKVNFSNELKVLPPKSDSRPLKAYIGPGNNSKLIKAVLRKRWWWHFTEEFDSSVNFVWTQIKVEQYFEWQDRAVRPLRVQATAPKGQGDCLLNAEEAAQLRQADKKHAKHYGQAFPHREHLAKGCRVPTWTTPRVQNHLPSNFVIGNKKALFYTLKGKLSAAELEGMIPETFHVTQGIEDEQYSQFISSFYREQRARKAAGNSRATVWIVKPGESTNRGNGITVHYKPESIKKIIKRRERHGDGTLKTYIIQKYIERPLLYRGRKFDIRHFLAMTSVGGLVKGYWYQEGYLRTSSSEFTLSSTDALVHLTNDAVQAWAPDYGRYERGNKLSYEEFEKYLARQGVSFLGQVLPRIRAMCGQVLAAAGHLVDPAAREHNFELFGLDFMVDEQFRPVLIEVNSNPCLEMNCPVLARLLPELLDNLLRLALDPLCPPPLHWPDAKRPLLRPQANRFELIFDSRLHGAAGGLELFGTLGKLDEDDTFEDDGRDLLLS